MNSTQEKISLFEKYILAEDQDSFIGGLDLNQNESSELKLLHSLKKGKRFEDVDPKLCKKAVKNWSSLQTQEKELYLIDLLARIEAAKDDSTLRTQLMKEFNIKTLNFKFDSNAMSHSNKVNVQDNTKSVSSNDHDTDLHEELDEELDIQKYIERCLNPVDTSHNLESLQVNYLYKVDILGYLKSPGLNSTKIQNAKYYFKRIPDYSGIDNIVPALIEFKKLTKKNNSQSAYISNTFYQKLTTEQLNLLFKKDSDLKVQLISIKFNKEFSNYISENEINLDRNEVISPQEVNQLIEYINDWLRKNFKSFNGSIIYYRFQLEYGLKTGNYDFESLVKLLELNYNKQHLKMSQGVINYYNSEFEGRMLGFAQFQMSESEIIDQYVRILLMNSKKYSKIVKKVITYYPSKYEFQIIDIESKILKGEELGNLDENQHGKNFIRELYDRRILKILPHTKSSFGLEDPVSIHLEIKNIRSLKVKLFKIDTISYLKMNKRDFDSNLLLEGFQPSQVEEFKIPNFKPQLLLRKTFDFESIQQERRGIFIVDFESSELTTRAVIKKGGLGLLSQQKDQGVVFWILDEEKNVCKGKDTGIILNGTWMPVDDKGEIMVPFQSKKKYPTEAIVCHEKFANLAPFKVAGRGYAFYNSLIFNEESIREGEMANFILNPKFMINGKLAKLNKLNNIEGRITSTNIKGISTIKNYRGLQLSYDKDLVLKFLMPKMIKSLNIELFAELQVEGEEKPRKFSTKDKVTLSTLSGVQDIAMPYLVNSKDHGYAIKMCGKNGEMVPGRNLEIKISRNYSTKKVTRNITTAKNKYIVLGKLAGALQISVKADISNNLYSWNIAQDFQGLHIQKDYSICQGESLVLPEGPLGVKYKLLNYDINGGIVRDFSKEIQLNDGQILIENLKLGDYTFSYVTLSEVKKVSIKVLKAERWSYSDTYLSSSRKLMRIVSEMSYLHFKNISETKNNMSITVNGNDLSRTKVHVLLHRVVPKITGLIHKTSRSICPSYPKDEFGLPKIENTFLNERVVHDEVMYTNQRRDRQHRLGVNVDQPQSLMQPQYVKDTNTNLEYLNTGQDFKQVMRGADQKAFGGEKKANLSNKTTINYSVLSIGPIFDQNVVQLNNIPVDDKGMVTLDKSKFEGFNAIEVIVSDPMSYISKIISFSNSEAKLRDIRNKPNKTAGSAYSTQRWSDSVVGEETLNFENSKEFRVISNLREFMEIQKVVFNQSKKQEFKKWEFLLEWNELEEKKKIEYLDEFFSHEFNVFVYMNDPVFFEQRVKNSILQKSRLDIIDILLLGRVEEAKLKFKTAKIHCLRNPFEFWLAVYILKDQELELC